MKTGTQWSIWSITQACFWSMLLWGFYGGSHGAILVACFFAWVFGILSLCYLSEDFRRASSRQTQPVPAWLIIGLDALAIGIFVFHGYIATGVALLVCVLMYASSIEKRHAS